MYVPGSLPRFVVAVPILRRWPDLQSRGGEGEIVGVVL